MEQDFSFIILVIAGIVLLTLFIFSLRTRVKPGKQDFAYEDEILPEISEVEPVQTSISEQPIAVNNSTETRLTSDNDEKLIVLYIEPQQGRRFHGQEILRSFKANQMLFGDMAIYHRYENYGDEVKILFSLAQATEPGTFDPDKLASQTCMGLCLFMQLTGAEHDLNTYETFILTAQKIADDLKGLLVDRQRNALSSATTRYFKNLVKKHLEALKSNNIANVS